MNRPLLVGESNPYGPRPHLALYPYPERSAGGRLRAHLGMTMHQYMTTFERVNLLSYVPKRWRVQEAKNAAGLILGAYRHSTTIIMLGARVAAAFGLADLPVWKTRMVDNRFFVRIPHPSSRCREWNKPGSRAKLDKIMKGVL